MGVCSNTKDFAVITHNRYNYLKINILDIKNTIYLPIICNEVIMWVYRYFLKFIRNSSVNRIVLNIIY
jgi:hypothetical protein